MTTPADSYRLLVKGHVSRAATHLIEDRFGEAARVVEEQPDTVLEIAADQAALRSLLGLLWDLGHEVQCVVRPDATTSE